MAAEAVRLRGRLAEAERVIRIGVPILHQWRQHIIENNGDAAGRVNDPEARAEVENIDEFLTTAGGFLGRRA